MRFCKTITSAELAHYLTRESEGHAVIHSIKQKVVAGKLLFEVSWSFVRQS